MDKKRRTFLKMAGATALAGISAPAVVKLTSTPSFAATEKEGNKAEGAKGETATLKTAEKKERLGIVIDMRKFYEKPELLDKAVAACINAHNIPQITDKNGNVDHKSEIKWIWKEPFEKTFPEHSNYHRSETEEKHDYLVLCNHCDHPPCVRVCPTKATFVYEKNGIVAMDYHRCIGCRFCMMGCPYGARSFNWMDPRPYIKHYNPDFPTRMRGVVEKCTMCSERIALGLQPACVEAVKEEKAMYFGDLADPKSEIRKVLAEENTIQRKPSLGTNPSVFYIV